MKIKKPSLKGMKNCGYLGRFAKDAYVQQGHNYSGKMSMAEIARAMDRNSAFRENTIRVKNYEDLRDKGKMSTRDYMESNWEEKEQNEARQDSYGEDSKGSSGKYGWETKIVNGKRQHRLIRK